MTRSHKQLQFDDVDGLAFAAARGKFDSASLPTTYIAQQVGPFLELMHLSGGGLFPRPGEWLALNDFAPFVTALEQAKESWICPRDGHLGYIRAARSGQNADSQLTCFLMTAKRAGREISCLPSDVSGQLVAAMEELENNIHEHAYALETGILAYRAGPGVFEFVIADRGIGILRSLRLCEAYVDLPDEGKALEAALTDGVSRYGQNSKHGHGFRPIFTGLVNLHGELRFRSGDHAISMDGTSPELATARTSQKVPIDGFLASVKCHAPP